MPPVLRSHRRRLLVVGLGAALFAPFSMGAAGAQTPAPSSPAAGAAVVGKVVRAFSDPTLAHAQRKGKRAQALTWIQPAHGAAVRVPTDQAAQLPIGATVKVTVGGAVTDAASTQDGLQAAHQVLASSVVAAATPPPTAAASTPPYTDTVTVVKVHPAGDPSTDPNDSTLDTQDATSISTLVDQVNGPVADYWESQTRGAVHLTAVPSTKGDDWVTSAYDCSNPQGMFGDIATQVGFTPGSGQHLLLYISEDPTVDCEDGLGDVSSSITDGGSAYAKGIAGAPEVLTSVITHELGHNFGLGHSGEEECDNSVETGTCGADAYADMYDVMGYSWGAMGALNAQQAALVDGLPADEQEDLRGVAGSQTVTLSPMGTTGGKRSVTLLGPGGVEYWLEYRSAVGQDAWLTDPVGNDGPPLAPGVLVHIAGDGPRTANGDGDTSLLLDTTPSPAANWGDDWQTPLTGGHSVWLSGMDYYVTVKSTTSTTAVVRIQAGDAALPRDLNHNYVPDLLAADSSGALYDYPGNGTGGFGARSLVGHGWQTRNAIVMAGDLDGDGTAQDLLARDPAGNLWFYPGNGHGGFYAPRSLGGGWQAMNALLAPGDLTGDGIPDVLARRRSDGVLLLYPGNGAGGLRSPTRIGGGWGGMTSFVATGDWDLNGTSDFVVRNSAGGLLLYGPNAQGAIRLVRTIAYGGWNVFTSITGVGDWDGDGAADLLARRSDGSMWLYPGNGAGGFGTARKVSAGWTPYRLAA